MRSTSKVSKYEKKYCPIRLCGWKVLLWNQVKTRIEACYSELVVAAFELTIGPFGFCPSNIDSWIVDRINLEVLRSLWVAGRCLEIDNFRGCGFNILTSLDTLSDDKGGDKNRIVGKGLDAISDNCPFIWPNCRKIWKKKAREKLGIFSWILKCLDPKLFNSFWNDHR